MSEYKPTEYVVDFGDYRSSRFVELNMALIEQNGAKLQERIVRCGDCRHFANWDGVKEFPWCVLHGIAVELDSFCAWAERRDA